MESPHNPTPGWIDPNGSKIPAYLRKEKGGHAHTMGVLKDNSKYEVETHFQRIQRERQERERFDGIKDKTEKELRLLEKRFPLLTPQLLINVRKTNSDYRLFEGTPKITADYIKSHQTDLQRIEDLLDPRLSDEELERQIQELKKKPIKNSPFWYYIDELTNTDSHGNVRVIDLETYDENKDFEYVPVRNVRFYYWGYHNELETN